MDPMTALAIGSLGAGFISGGANTANSAYQTEENRKFAREENEKNRALQKDLATNAYQYAVEDMRKAGLNPYLAYDNGGAHGVTGSSIGFQGQSKIDMQSFLSGLSLAKNLLDTKFDNDIALGKLQLENRKVSALEMKASQPYSAPHELHVYKNNYYSK